MFFFLYIRNLSNTMYTGLDYEQLGIYALTFRFSTDLCFTFILSFYSLRPNCL
jgi:hypothetical protein